MAERIYMYIISKNGVHFFAGMRRCRFEFHKSKFRKFGVKIVWGQMKEVLWWELKYEYFRYTIEETDHDASMAHRLLRFDYYDANKQLFSRVRLRSDTLRNGERHIFCRALRFSHPRRSVDLRILGPCCWFSYFKNFKLCVPSIERQGYIGLKV